MVSLFLLTPCHALPTHWVSNKVIVPQFFLIIFVFEVVKGSVRVLDMKKTRKTRGRLISRGKGGGAYNQMTFFVSKWMGL